ncbi:MAG: DUF2889 domain-containing protein [Syntrophaceae bacterium]|nr:DUF2889 domain-containing protein [Syntrophaceae bacterium]
MQKIGQPKRKKLHTRKIEISTYEYDEQKIIVEGFLKDERFRNSHLITGEKFPIGVIHHMQIRLLINLSSFVIEDVDVDMPGVPREVCRETRGSLAPIKGLTISPGFRAKVKKMAGGIKGCTHLVELLSAMAPAFFQGYAAYLSQKPSWFDKNHIKIVGKFLVNTCHAWREDGPFMEMFKKHSI